MIGRSVLGALFLVATAASPAAALNAEYDGFYGIFPEATVGRGITLVEVLAVDEARVSIGLINLAPRTEYRLVFSKAPCSRFGTSDENTGTKTFRTDDSGGAYRVEVVPWLWGASAPVPKSARIVAVEGGQRRCVKAATFSRVEHTTTGNALAEMEYSRFWEGSRQGIVILDHLDGTTGRLSWTFSGLASGTYVLRGNGVGCNRADRTANRLYSVSFTAKANGRSASSTQVEVENDEKHWVGSNRLRRAGHAQWGCARGFVTDLIIDP